MNKLQPDDLHGPIATPVLRLRLLGQMCAEDAAGRNVLPRSRKTRGLLAVLALAAPHPVLRSKLTDLFWSRRGRQQARGSLRQSVHELQRSLGPQAASLLYSDRNQLALSDQGLWVDACTPQQALDLKPDGLGALPHSLLDDLDGLDPAFDNWLTDQRRELARRAQWAAVDGLDGEQMAEASISAAGRLLAIDKFNEAAWYALIQSHLDRGDQAGGNRAYEQYIRTATRAKRAPSRIIEGLFRPSPSRSIGGTVGVRSGGVRLCVLAPRRLDRSGTDGRLSGLAEEITAVVSRFRWISCLVGGSAETVEAEYLLDSTVQYSSRRARIIVRLLDQRAANNIVWTQRFDREVDDVLSLQDDIAAQTAARVDPELLIREGEHRARDRSTDMSAYNLTLQAIPAIYRLEPLGFRTAGELLAAAVAAEPGNAAAHAWWAYWHLFLVGQAWADDPASATRRAGELADRAVTLDPGDARALALVGHVRGFLHKLPQEARALHERSLSLNPNLPLAWCFSGLAHSYLGDQEVAIDQISRALHLSPHDPHAFFFDMALMMPYFLRGEFEQASVFGRRAVELNPGFTSTYKGYLATLGHLRLEQEAARVLARLLTLEPGFSIRAAIERSPLIRREDLALYAEGLRKAGLPEG